MLFANKNVEHCTVCASITWPLHGTSAAVCKAKRCVQRRSVHAHRILSNSRVKVLLADVGGILSTASGQTHGKRCGARTRLLSKKEDDDDHYQDGGDGGDGDGGDGDDTRAHTRTHVTESKLIDLTAYPAAPAKTVYATTFTGPAWTHSTMLCVGRVCVGVIRVRTNVRWLRTIDPLAAFLSLCCNALQPHSERRGARTKRTKGAAPPGSACSRPPQP